ncbi:hypothetical protein Golax_010060 [Gossypium laxum]|uniref:Dolichyl-diphosphooligosaccharide--protein glycosyltransferase subunit KCP2 n=1 Tax=Gossypium laxum TaxID=34288 RepID=A0A7J8ZG19_9ROSI|nr:hypothetical protein [Gossypium laxum]
MAGSRNSMLYPFLLFTVMLSLQMMYRGKLASSELFTILGGFISSFLFLVSLTFIGNFQEAFGMRTGWGAGSDNSIMHPIKILGESNIWHVKMPLVVNVTMEMHESDKALRQFEFRQLISVAPRDLDDLHLIDL